MADLNAAVACDAETVAAYTAAGHWNDETPQHWLRHWAETRPDAPAILAGDDTLTYAELYDAARRIATGLAGLGLRAGDPVAIQLPNVPAFLIAYHGVQMMGGVLTLLHMPYRAGELGPLLRHGEARAVICGAATDGYDAPATFRGLAAEVPSLEHVVECGGGAADTSFEALLDSPAAETPDPFEAPSAAAPAVLAFTSGTSSAPKAVVHPYRTMACNHRIYAEAFGLTTDDVVLSAPPFSHIYGLCVANITLRAGAANALMPAYTPDGFADAIVRTGTTVLFCGPVHMIASIRAGQFTAEVGATLRSIVFAGSACPPGLIPEAEALCPNATGHQMFGMTETLMQLATPLDAPATVRHGSIGVANALHEVRVMGPDDAPVPDGAEGEMQFRGPTLFTGYYGNASATEEAFTADGWFHTGDLVVRDADGNIAMTGRVKDLINRGGIKINPIDVEGLIDQHPAVLLCAIAPMPDEVMGERACLFVQPQPGASLTLDQVLDYLREQGVAKLKWPERLELVDQMPLTPTRKIIKSALVAGLAD